MATVPELGPTEVAALADRIAANVNQAVKVPEGTLREVLVALLAEGHVLIEDNPGVGKTALARALARSTDAEKQSQLERLAEFHARHADEAPAMLKQLQQAVIDNRNVFEVLVQAVRCCSLGQITSALFEVGGQYRRSM